MNCTSILYNPQIRDQVSIGRGSSREVFLFEDGKVIKLPLNHVKSLVKEHDNLLEKHYTPYNIDELINILVEREREDVDSYTANRILYYFDQTFSEWILWENATEKEKEFLAPIIGVGYDELGLPFTIMEKAELISNDWAIGISPKSHLTNKCDASTCKHRIGFCDCKKCSKLKEHTTYRHLNSNNLGSFISCNNYQLDFDALLKFCKENELTDVINNISNVGIFDNKVKLIDYGFVKNAEGYSSNYTSKRENKNK